MDDVQVVIEQEVVVVVVVEALAQTTEDLYD